MPRPKIYATDAERQAAYNERQREKAREAERQRHERIKVRQAYARQAQGNAAIAVRQNLEQAAPDAPDRPYLMQILRTLETGRFPLNIDQS